MSDTVSTFCVCGKRNYASRGDAVRERNKLRANRKSRERWNKQVRSRTSGRDVEPYWCSVGGLWHLGHKIGKHRRQRRGLRG